MNELPLVTTIAAAFTGAWLLGLFTQRLGLSPIVGYLLAGVVIGPYTPGFVGNISIANELAGIGIILLMFGVGINFRLQDLLAVRSVVIPGAIWQNLFVILLTMTVLYGFGFPIQTGLVMGMAMSVSSTVVLLRVFGDAGALASESGHVAVGWTIVEDIITVVLLVLIPMFGVSAVAGAPNASTGPDMADLVPETGWSAALGLLITISLALLKVAALVALVLVAGSRVVPWILVRVAKLRSRELFTLTILVIAIATAAGSAYFFGVSMALGAFLAGMVVAQSPVSHQAAADALPMRDAFAVLFFVSVGMLFNPMFVVREPLLMLAGLAIVLLARPFMALILVTILGHSARTALTVAIGVAQIGEFSFVLSEVARQHGLMPDSGHSLLVATAILSITLNPMYFRSRGRIEDWAKAHPRLWRLLNRRADARTQRINLAAAQELDARRDQGERLAIVVGYGPVGRSVDRLLREAGITTVVIDLNMETVLSLNEEGRSALFGDASHQSILEQAGVKRASHLILTLPHSSERAAVVAAARCQNATVRILVRAHYLSEREELESLGATAAVFEEAEAAVALARLVLSDTGARREVAEQKIRDLRLQLIRENIANIRIQHVRNIMVPWKRVRSLQSTLPRQDVLQRIAELRHARWPVIDAASKKVLGYLLAKDLIAADPDGKPWTLLVRPLKSVSSDDSVDSVLMRMQDESVTVCMVEAGGIPVGLITIEDILEQIVGRLEDEDPQQADLSLREAVEAGGVILELASTGVEEAIRELCAAIPASRMPRSAEVAELALAREREMSTDVGLGVAIPHARYPNLTAPLVVFGRSSNGLAFSPAPAEPVRLLFLLVSPADQPEVQLTFMGEIARVVNDETARARLVEANTKSEIINVLSSMQRREVQPR